MKKYFIFAIAALALSFAACGDKTNEPSDNHNGEGSSSGNSGGSVNENVQAPTGAGSGIFSVSADKKVFFSIGNLQYKANTGTWRFAEHQYDTIGVNNSKISASYSGWIDLFGWGTSGWNSGAVASLPYSISSNYNDYYPGGAYNNNLTGVYANADWGVYNKITNGGNQDGLWRTLTEEEWLYLFNTRTNAKKLRGQAAINDVHGYVILPDNWKTPDGVSFTSSPNNWTTNAYSDTEDSWGKMAANGAIFLPAAGLRSGQGGKGVMYCGSYGYYWTTSYRNNLYAYAVIFYENGIQVDYYDYRNNGKSVRLVYDVK